MVALTGPVSLASLKRASIGHPKGTHICMTGRTHMHPTTLVRQCLGRLPTLSLLLMQAIMEMDISTQLHIYTKGKADSDRSSVAVSFNPCRSHMLTDMAVA